MKCWLNLCGSDILRDPSEFKITQTQEGITKRERKGRMRTDRHRPVTQIQRHRKWKNGRREKDKKRGREGGRLGTGKMERREMEEK